MAIETGRLPQVEREDMTREQLQILVDLGKEMRQKDENYWVNNVLGLVAVDQPNVALCPNLRLPLEAQAFRDVGGYVVRCERLNANDSLYISPDRDPNDITETALQFWPADYYLTTKPDQIQLLEAQARTLYRYLQGKHIDAQARERAACIQIERSTC